MRHIVIGAGPAGVTACETLRDLDPAAQITLIGAEPEPPYSRMAIPYLLVEDINERGTYLRRTENYYSDRGIEILRQAVSSVDPLNRTLALDNGDTLGFDRLLIATGASPLQPSIPGVDLPGVHSCWTLSDARAIAERAKPHVPVVLIGAGFIGCIILEALVQRGVQLTVVEREGRLVARMLDAAAGGLLKRWCERKGVTVLTSTNVTAIEQDGEGLAVSLDNGATLPAGLVITATGVQSNTGFLADSDIATGQGILVDEYLATNHEGIFAAGDVAQGRDYSTGRFEVQAIQPTAVEHGRIAAVNMVHGKSVAHQGSLNMNVLNTLGLISTSFGRWMGVAEGDSAVLVDEDRYLYFNLQFDGNYLAGASTLGHTQHIGVLRGLIRSRVSLGAWKQRLMDDPTRVMEAYLGSVQGLA